MKETLILGDAFEEMASLQPGSIHMVATDPPYFLDGQGADWTKDETAKMGERVRMPAGMKFDRRQSRDFESFMRRCGDAWMNALKPGGFACVFSQPRLVHRAASGLEDAGFEIREQAIRTKQSGQPKAQSLNQFIYRKGWDVERTRSALRLTCGWRTPQMSPRYDAIVIAQKPREGTFLDNWLAHGVGLMNTHASVRGIGDYGNMRHISSDERDPFNVHPTIKPVAIMEWLISLFTQEGQTVLDPFVGSGTTLVATRNLDRHGIGIEQNPRYVDIARRRLDQPRQLGLEE